MQELLREAGSAESSLALVCSDLNTALITMHDARTSATRECDLLRIRNAQLEAEVDKLKSASGLSNASTETRSERGHARRDSAAIDIALDVAEAMTGMT